MKSGCRMKLPLRACRSILASSIVPSIDLTATLRLQCLWYPRSCPVAFCSVSEASPVHRPIMELGGTPTTKYVAVVRVPSKSGAMVRRLLYLHRNVHDGSWELPDGQQFTSPDELIGALQADPSIVLGPQTGGLFDTEVNTTRLAAPGYTTELDGILQSLRARQALSGADWH
eukprot:m.975239 g.975239  ORF g.975239 m.975239 type:complete len:172 (+) comp23938_c0_seq55:3004-3519(+)